MRIQTFAGGPGAARAALRLAVPAVLAAFAACKAKDHQVRTEKNEPPPAPEAPAPEPAAAPEPPAPAPPERPGQAADPKWSDILSQEERSLDIRSQESRFVAQRLYETALQAHKSGQFARAKDLLEEALAKDPSHAEAQRLHREVAALLSQPPQVYGTIREFVENQLRVREEQTRLEVDNHLKRADRFFLEKQYDEAIREFELAEEKIRAIPYPIELRGTLPEVHRKIERSRDEREAERKRFETIQRQVAAREAEDEEERRKKEILGNIKHLMRLALLNFDLKRYDKTGSLCEEILLIDPHYRAARELKEDALKARHRHQYADYLRTKIEQWKNLADDDDESVVPYADTIRYPSRDDWAEISKRVGVTLVQEEGSGADDPDVLAIKSKLDNLKMDLDFTDATLTDIIDFIRDFAQVNIHISADVDAATSENKVSFKVRDLVLRNVLKLLLAQYNLAYTFQDKVLLITTPEKSQGTAQLQIHDVRDLLLQITDFPGPIVELRPPGADPSGGGIAGATFTLDEPRGAISEEQIETLIKENVGRGTWDSGDYSITLTPNQQLLVNHTPEVQQEIRSFLTRLRQYTGAMVQIETRFIQADDDFLEDVGVDIRGIENVPASAGARGIAEGTASDLTPLGGDREPGFVSQESARNELSDLRFRTFNSFFRVGATGAPAAEYQLGNRLSNTGGVGMQYRFLGEHTMNFVLRALQKNEIATVLHAPSITVFNTQRSNLLVVTQTAYIQDFDVEVSQFSGFFDPIIGIVQDGIVLDVRPIISHDRQYVTLEMRPAFAELQGALREIAIIAGGPRLQLPHILLQRAETTVRVPDRGTLMLSGFKNILKRDLYSGVPLIENIPVVNFFFSRKGKSEEKRRVFILVTPRIIDLAEEEAVQH